MSGREYEGEQELWMPAAESRAPISPTVPLVPPTQLLPDPDAANSPTMNLSAPAPGELLRFGPGVPVPTATVDLSQATAVWRGEAQPTDGDAARRRRRLLIAWFLPLLVLIAVLAILLWQRSDSPLAVSDAAVRAASPSLTCDGTASITATIHTNGADGTITYRWRRSDGTSSDTLRQQAAKGSTDVHVVLLWSFHGKGKIDATATLDVLSPNQLSASTTFAYSCG